MKKGSSKYIQRLKSLAENPQYDDIMKKLTLGQELLSYESKVFILTFALLSLRVYENNKNYKKFLNLAYYIILKYSIIHNDYKPLYDFSINIGFYPISNYILQNELMGDDININDYILNSSIEEYETDKGYIPTLEQHLIFNKVDDVKEKEIAIVAPTSYGKSEAIIRHIRSNLEKYNNFVVVVPNKTLLNEFYREVLDYFVEDDVLVINHDEMFNDANNKTICIFTQERALRLLNSRSETEFSYDVMYIDEAHKILDNDDRSRLLARLIRLNKELNSNVKIIYLSPMISDIKNLQVSCENDIKLLNISNNVKELDLYILKDMVQYNYNIYTDKFYKNDTYNTSPLKYITNNSDNKNLIYMRSVKDTEDWAKNISSLLMSEGSIDIKYIENELSPLYKIQIVLKKYVHEDYLLNNIITQGVLFLHGQLPDHIRPYLEYKFKTCDDIKYLVANSVVMEGVNLPIDNIFIVSLYGLKSKHKDFINLIGRAGRLKYIFKNSKNNNLTKLLPKIHILDESGESNLSKHFSQDVFPDVKKNPLLENTSSKEKATKKNQEIIKNENIYFELERNKYRSEEDKIRYYTLKYLNNLYNLDDNLMNNIISRVVSSKKKIDETEKINTIPDSLSFIYKTFVEGFLKDYDNAEDDEYISGIIKYDSNLNRLKNEKAVKYYSKYVLKYRQKAFNEQVNYEISYFKKVVSKYKRDNNSSTESACYFYVGDTRGECKWKKWDGTVVGKRNVYFCAKDKEDDELPTFAIAKLKVESDFVKYKLQPFIRFMFEVGIITNYVFNMFIYGTNKENEIRLMKKGFPIGLLDEFRDSGQIENIDFKSNIIKNRTEFMDYYESVKDDLLRFEIAQVLHLKYK